MIRKPEHIQEMMETITEGTYVVNFKLFQKLLVIAPETWLRNELLQLLMTVEKV